MDYLTGRNCWGEHGFIQDQIQESAYRAQKAIDETEVGTIHVRDGMLVLKGMPSCVITWTIEDIHHLRESSELPTWTDDQAGSFLESISRLIADRSIELGWEIIADAMPGSDLGGIELP
jgi:hypothetical protein